MSWLPDLQYLLWYPSISVQCSQDDMSTVAIHHNFLGARNVGFTRLKEVNRVLLTLTKFNVVPRHGFEETAAS